LLELKQIIETNLLCHSVFYARTKRNIDTLNSIDNLSYHKFDGSFYSAIPLNGGFMGKVWEPFVSKGLKTSINPVSFP